MNELEIFSSDEFGTVRTMLIDNEPWLVAKDVAAALGYQNARDAVAKHVEAEDKGTAQCATNGGPQKLAIINESGLYALVFGSQTSKAREFRKWVTGEVLPELRRDGYYQLRGKIEVPQVIDTPEQIRGLIESNEEIMRRMDAISRQMRDMPLFASEADEIRERVAAKCAEILGGKQARAYKNASIRGSVCSRLYADLNKRFGAVASYKSIKRRYLDGAYEFIKRYKPNADTVERIKKENEEER